jgi:hypothetical protein
MKLLNLEIAYLPALLPGNWLKITMYALVTSAVLIVLMSVGVCEIKIMFPETGPAVKCERYWS